ncbi:uncharacterized protein MYCFIDRAFT_179081 [Pseudocercospora fijiensis CIRAD86]|uniref:F-box domain-containing protein n=1 Tax=Pseudocercospora fijiensis (strain CIRAD86) TaxID=383855 RepID=M2YIG5_PSEFD|nr:uncharacterized protein MYCFIDRAFT_179081 [Pseudocercospora fijiensis CIRAD86]EME77565.1 hypothetical protein MYCFIDRAFT_179081 [Pseudocercospora fijiensis CIRAD86]
MICLGYVFGRLIRDIHRAIMRIYDQLRLLLIQQRKNTRIANGISLDLTQHARRTRAFAQSMSMEMWKKGLARVPDAIARCNRRVRTWKEVEISVSSIRIRYSKYAWLRSLGAANLPVNFDGFHDLLLSITIDISFEFLQRPSSPPLKRLEQRFLNSREPSDSQGTNPLQPTVGDISARHSSHQPDLHQTGNMPATMLHLPRELYLEIIDSLSPKDRSTLARLSKDHYLAVQEPLYAHTSISAWPRLVVLVRTLMKTPIVSSLSAKQRLNWHKLSDHQLRERSIKTLDITLKSSETRNATGADLARMVGAISRVSPGVRGKYRSVSRDWKSRRFATVLEKNRKYTLLTQLQNLSLPDVVRLTMYLGYYVSEAEWRRQEIDINLIQETKINLWDLCFGGSVLPDLRHIEADTHHHSPEKRPTTLAEASKLQRAQYRLRRGRFFDVVAKPFDVLYGIKKMESISLNCNHLLESCVLESLFDSNIIPQNLTKLEITNCPSLHQTVDLAALSMLLNRGLRLLQHLKLHIQGIRGYMAESEETSYKNHINNIPHHHLCNVVREAGQQIKHLDLALPFACKNIFLPIPRTKRDRVEPRTHPHIPYTPPSTLPDRLIAEGYRHRRLIVWHGICRESHDWREMKIAADDQGERVSWEIVSSGDDCASWHVDGCLALGYQGGDVLVREGGVEG